jgi:hypothetical protein
MRTILLLLSAVAVSAAQVHFSPEDIAVNVDGKPFTVFHYGTDAAKPYLSPLRSASGKIVTRHFPMEYIETESHDHMHHRGLWFSYDDVNGVKFWENDPSYTKGNMGKQVVTSAKWKDGDKTGTLTATIEWRDGKGKVLIVETREMTFRSDAQLRIIDFRTTLTAAEPVTFGDTKEGAFAIRLADSFTERKGGKITDADGRATMAKVWGKRSNWVDYTAEVEGEKIGVAIFDAPSNPRHPTYWHARDYGLFALNPFGQNAFDQKLDESKWSLPKGDKISFLWRVAIHPGDADVAALYREFAGK